jgi:hypothetical protein
MTKLVLLAAFAVAALSTVSFAQNRFEGYNIILDVPTTQRAFACAIRYSPPSTTITITDIDRSTPMKVTACGGSGTSLTAGGSGSATMRADAGTYKWCFEGEDKRYRITFAGDQLSGPMTYDWIPDVAAGPTGSYNVKDFGETGDGRTDDTIAVQSALAYLATKNGGTLFFPEGDYAVGGTPNFKGIVMPAGVTIQGMAGLHTGAATNNVVKKNPSRITLNGSNRALFRIGECTEEIAFKDIELLANSQQNTIGIEAVGAYNTSQDLTISDAAFSTFWRAIYAHGLPQTNLNWQFDYIHISRTRFVFNTDAAIYTNIRNTDWRIQDSLFVNPRRTPTQKADSMMFERAAGILIDNTVGGGFTNAIGGTFLSILDSGNVLVSHSQTESMTNSFYYNEAQNPDAGDYSAPVTFLNSVFGAPIVFNARRTFVSVGTLYAANTFKADERLRVYSTGDRFCHDGYTIACGGGTKNNFDRATVIFMTGQPSEGRVTGHPTFFGTDVQFAAGVQMPSFAANALPPDKANGSIVYCSNCRRATTPCSSGGSGAPSMVVHGQWSCF